MDREPMYLGKHGAYCFTHAILHIVFTHEHLSPTTGDPRYCCMCDAETNESDTTKNEIPAAAVVEETRS